MIFRYRSVIPAGIGLLVKSNVNSVDSVELKDVIETDDDTEYEKSVSLESGVGGSVDKSVW